MLSGLFGALLWGSVIALSLLAGALLAYRVDIPDRTTSVITAFASGVLISILAFNLMDEALRTGGFALTAGGFLAGAVVYGGSVLFMSGRRARKDGKDDIDSKLGAESSGGMNITAGATVESAVEAMTVGLTIVVGGVVNLSLVVGLAIENFPEAIVGVRRMKSERRSREQILGTWAFAAIVVVLSSLFGYLLFSVLPVELSAFALAVAAGTILVMIINDMVPEAYGTNYDLTGLATTLGFLAAFTLNTIL